MPRQSSSEAKAVENAAPVHEDNEWNITVEDSLEQPQLQPSHETAPTLPPGIAFRFGIPLCLSVSRLLH
jgi:hypothetical protein